MDRVEIVDLGSTNETIVLKKTTEDLGARSCGRVEFQSFFNTIVSFVLPKSTILKKVKSRSNHFLDHFRRGGEVGLMLKR